MRKIFWSMMVMMLGLANVAGAQTITPLGTVVDQKGRFVSRIGPDGHIYDAINRDASALERKRHPKDPQAEAKREARRKAKDAQEVARIKQSPTSYNGIYNRDDSPEVKAQKLRAYQQYYKDKLHAGSTYGRRGGSGTGAQEINRIAREARSSEITPEQVQAATDPQQKARLQRAYEAQELRRRLPVSTDRTMGR